MCSLFVLFGDGVLGLDGRGLVLGIQHPYGVGFAFYHVDEDDH